MHEELTTDAQGLIYKTQTYLKHANRLEELRQRKSRSKLQSIEERKKEIRNKGDTGLIRPEDLVHKYRNSTRSYRDYLNRKRRDFEETKDTGLVFVLRIHGEKGLSDVQQSLFRVLKLKKMHEARVYSLTPQIQKLIQSLENLIIYGKIQMSTLQTLIKKRGYIRKEKQILPISSNKLIEQELGDLGCICIEDVVSELMILGPKSEDLMKRLCTFKLTKPTEGYLLKRLPKNKQGSWGNWGEELDQLVIKMLQEVYLILLFHQSQRIWIDKSVSFFGQLQQFESKKCGGQVKRCPLDSIQE